PRLASVTIGSGVSSIGNMAFYRCPLLKSVTCLATLPPTLYDDNFDAASDVLRVPSGSLTNYSYIKSWADKFSSIVAIP
ncbi:MAG: leucine-rich repeat domain-containing protein, partial [Bacteroidales bacterium]|nr:leucine-rich repeat domain-containing protein [Bacteroidales bacterium]